MADHVPQTQRLHNLALHAMVPSARHPQLLHILTGIAGHQPTQITQQHSIFRPEHVAARKVAADEGGASQVVLDLAKARRRAAEAERARLAEGPGAGTWVMRAIEEMVVAAGSEDDEMEGPEAEVDSKLWQWTYNGLPDPNLKTVTARASTVTSIPYAIMPAVYANSLNYRPVTSYLVHGHRWVHGNVVLYLHRVLQLPPDIDSSDKGGKAPSMTKEALGACKVLDGSGAYVLEANIVVDGEGPAEGLNELLGRATRELLALQEAMRGCVDLRVVDRLSVDTRAK